MANAAASPDTIVLIHGFWVTPRSWEHWIAHDEGRGFNVLAPAEGVKRIPLSQVRGSFPVLTNPREERSPPGTRSSPARDR
jgi:hypothetical protein